MIKLLAEKYNKPIACFLLCIFYAQFLSAYAPYRKSNETFFYSNYSGKNSNTNENSTFRNEIQKQNNQNNKTVVTTKNNNQKKQPNMPEPNIGGPAAPESSSFKSVGADNLVSLFTGDFSYNIPLLDVGGYPVNIYYSGGIGMEQEASWVGLGWNINPGSVSRNMRGVPDDFNGEDKLIQEQNTKPNKTWGASIGADLEALGNKKPKFNVNLGLSYNNYLGPALDVGAGLQADLTSVLGFEKTPVNVSASLGFKLSSRSGLSLSPSLNAKLPLDDKGNSIGAGVSTSYNSRTGISDISLSSQTQLNYSKNKQINGILNNAANELMSASISFARPTYMPTLRMPMENFSTTGQLELAGFGAYGFRINPTANGFYTESKVPIESQTVIKPLYGFMFSDKAVDNPNAVMDFNRVNDGAVTPNTPIISAPQYAYDIFSIQGEGTGGSIRAFRSDVGFMKDNTTQSKDRSLSFGADVTLLPPPPRHLGVNWNVVKTPTVAGAWNDNYNKINKTLKFQPTNTNGGSFENIYFRNPGETTVTNVAVLENLGKDNMVRFALGGSNANVTLDKKLELFNKKDNTSLGSKTISNINNTRDKRTQVTTFLNAEDASKIGLDRNIKNYDGTFINGGKIIKSELIERVSEKRLKHHISEIDVLEQSGMRYVYGIPVYNLYQKEYTFSVAGTPDADNQITFTTNETDKNASPHFLNSSKIDGYVMTQQTPAYANAFLLSGLLNPDYVDVTGDGITEDDLGSAVKFNYNKSIDNHKWRTPRKNGGATQLANFMDGSKTETKDNKATITYGEREVWYLNSIESKTSIALFKTASRRDAKGVKGALDGTVNAAENANKRLDQIDLYSKAEIKAKGIANARPLKTVHFVYDYSLCKGTPDNDGIYSDSLGKLTLKSIYFTYYGMTRNAKDKYVFNYGTATNNPNYTYNASDKWGTYKPKTANPSNNGQNLLNADFPYANYKKATADVEASAWSLSKILLPSGGQMEVQYEADDYAYVQDKRACDMFKIYGVGETNNFSTNNNLYKQFFINNSIINQDNDYVYIKLNSPLEAGNVIEQKNEIALKYLQHLNQIAFKIMLKLPKGYEPITMYAEIDNDNYGLCPNSSSINGGNNDIIFLKLKRENNKNPLVKTAIGLLLDNYPNQAFEGYEVEVNDLRGFMSMASGMISSLKDAFKNAEDQMRGKGYAKEIDLGASFVRLNNPIKKKIGGGVRVKRVVVKDNWDKMKGKFTATYGQDYDYTTTEKINGVEKIISSGVASYEPGIGSEENPFREIVKYSDKMPLATAQYGAIEMPVLESFFPSPSVGYSKVTVRSIHRKATVGTASIKSAIGKQVSEFYTAKDYPVKWNLTPMESRDYHLDSKLSIFYKTKLDRRTISQGFMIETNDMHGKMKSQKAYSESDEKTPLTSSTYFYKNTGTNGFNDKVKFVSNKEGGLVTEGNMGIDMELMTDVREFKVLTTGTNGQLQTDFFTFFPFPIFAIPLLFLRSNTENKYRAVTCTKLINYHSIEDSVIVMDKGSTITTKTIAYDAETGSPIVTKTANEFKDPIYNTSYPAYWAYSGMGLAYENIDTRIDNVSFNNGVISFPNTVVTLTPNMIFESGDEIFITKQGALNGCAPGTPTAFKIWAFDKNKNTTPLTVVNKDLVFLDSVGNLYSRTGVDIRIVRSGKRNSIGASLASFTSMKEPFTTNGNITKLEVLSTSNVVSASAIEYKEKWQTDADVFKKYSVMYDNCTLTEVLDCANGILEKSINPYVKGLIGNFKPHRSYTYYGSRMEKTLNTPATTQTDIRKQGYLENFYTYWNYDANNNLVQNILNVTLNKWVWNSEITKVNSKGQELETKNALNIYTAAQYGFDKNLTTAIANNSLVCDIFNEGFEDENYNESINGSYKCFKKNGFNTIGTITLEEEITKLKIAHSGNNSFKGGGTLNIKLKPTINTYEIVNKNTNKLILTTTGGIINGNIVPNSVYPNDAVIWGSLFNLQLDGLNFVEQYINVTTSGTYNFTQSIYDQSMNYYGPNTNIRTRFINTKTMDTLTGGFYLDRSGIGACQATNAGLTSGICLEVGIYKIISRINAFPVTLPKGQPIPLCSTPNGAPPRFLLNGSFTGFLSDVDVTCSFLKPIPAMDSMINPTFSPTPGKKMWFSAWVREIGIAPDTVTNYRNSKVGINFNNGTIILPNINTVGKIIEGWQKIEGEFTIPATATTMQLKLINNTGTANYWDDIRIHPFNANMKSYAYDDRTLRLMAELDENNFAAFYEYDEEGQLIRVKKETIQGIKTIKETRSAKQKQIVDIQ